MTCVSAGKSEGEIAWRRCEGIGSRGHVAGWLERRSGYFCLSEGTEGEEGSFSKKITRSYPSSAKNPSYIKTL